MKMKIGWIISAIIIITLVIVIFDSMPKKPYLSLNSGDVASIQVYAMNLVPPATKMIEDKDTINDIVNLLKTVETSHIVYTGHTGGQLVRFTLTMNNNEIVEVGVYVDNINTRIYGFARKSNYEVCEKLNSLGNRILDTAATQLQETRNAPAEAPKLDISYITDDLPIQQIQVIYVFCLACVHA